MTSFTKFFENATGNPPYPYQERLAEQRIENGLIRIPTGCGKTAAVVLAWVWRRSVDPESTPRRLVYCLPMRVLVEQTSKVVREWLSNLKPASNVSVTILMGGEEADDWELRPDADAILIGTQDLLLSRALNRGYGMSRARWPLAFGLLNTDCLWVFDEIQLMGSGLATTAQLEAFRRALQESSSTDSKNSQSCKCLWMSATMQRNWLKTVNFDPDTLGVLQLNESDLNEKQIAERYDAKKMLRKAMSYVGEFDKLAEQITEEHKRARGRTLVIANTVKRACALFDAVSRAIEPPKNKRQSATNDPTAAPSVVLVHSRFRPSDRAAKIRELLDDPGPSGVICISTQVVEAGVDVSATTLFTELAPWASLVQRFGRCNRYGDDPNAQVFWIDMEFPEDAKEAIEAAKPYSPAAMAESRTHLQQCNDVRSSLLPPVNLSFEHTHVIRRKDFIDLFDTTPDLAGNDIDIDRYVRDTEESDVRVFWRLWEGPLPPVGKEWRQIAREELCPAPIGEFREFLAAKAQQVRRWNFLDGTWAYVDRDNLIPGQTFLIHGAAGGYKPDRGWNPKSSDRVAPANAGGSSAAGHLHSEESNDDEPLSEIGRWQTIAEHTDEVCAELTAIVANLGLNKDESSALNQAARWHDWGKAHEVFCKALPSSAPRQDAFWAKGVGKWKKYARPHFRHELASALGVLGLSDGWISSDLRALVAYLIASHHGKVRVSIRSLPGEKRPDNASRFARGVWEGDELPSVDLGSGITVPQTKLSLEPMELGFSQHGEPSWAERVSRLRENFGIFRLAYMEALLRAADMRASKNAMREERS